MVPKALFPKHTLMSRYCNCEGVEPEGTDIRRFTALVADYRSTVVLATAGDAVRSKSASRAPPAVLSCRERETSIFFLGYRYALRDQDTT